MQKMSTSERDLVTQFLDTLSIKPSSLQPFLAELDATKLVKRVKGEFYNGVVMHSALLFLLAISVPSESKVPANQRVKYWFRGLEQIGAESVFGYAMRSDLKESLDSLILKAPRDPANSDIIHELFVGLYGTNRLREVVPNFAYVFGGFECSTPVIEPRVPGQETRVVSYCTGVPGAKEVPYVIYENIAPAVSLREYVETCSPEEYFEALIQLNRALKKGWETIKFVHNDLHYENALVRKLDKMYSLPYEAPDGGVVFDNTQVAITIIDLGSAHIEYEGRSYGFEGLERVGVFKDYPLPFIDMYKIYFFTLNWMLRAGNITCYNQAKRLAPFFYPQLDPDTPNFDNALSLILAERQKDVFYYLSLRTDQEVQQVRTFLEDAKRGRDLSRYPGEWIRMTSFTYDKFYEEILSVCSCDFLTSQPLSPIAHCQGQQCGTKKDALNSFLRRPLSMKPLPDNFFEFYDLDTLTRAGRTYRQEIRTSFQRVYRRARAEYFTTLQEGSRLFLQKSSSVDPKITLFTGPLSQLPLTARAYRERLVKIADADNIRITLDFAILVGRYIANVYKDKTLQGFLDGIEAQVEFSKRNLDQAIVGLRRDLSKWLGVINNPEVMALAKSSDDVSWLRISFPDSVATLSKVGL
jgi:hypothetical protein